MTARRHRRMAVSLASGLFVFAISPVAAQHGEAPSLNPLQVLDKATLKGFLEQPLFDPSRRLPPVARAAVVVVARSAPPSVEPPPVLHLLGVIHGQRDMAIVHRDNDEKTVVLHTGDLLGAWRVTVLPPVGVRLRDGDRAFDYALFGKTGASAGPVPVATDPGVEGSPALLTPAMTTRNARLQRRTY